MASKYERTRRITVGDGIIVELERASPRTALVVLAEVIAVAGPSLASLITGGGVRLADDTVVPWSAVLTFAPDTGISLLASALKHATALDGGRLLRAAEMLVVGSCTIQLAGGKPVEVSDAAQLDILLPDLWAVAGVAKAALELNLTPTSADAGGSPTPAPASP